MSINSKTWWGERLLVALEGFTDTGRLTRGRSYAKDHRVKQWIIKNGVVDAKIRGNKNPYFGVYKEPTYRTQVQMTHLSKSQWQKIIAQLTQHASFIAKLLINEIPENIEAVFEKNNCHFLPNSYKDFKVSCNCPDYAVPCKHIAGVCYRLASQLDNNPFLLFEMRGLAPEKLHQELIKSPLGQILADAQLNTSNQLTPVSSLHCQPQPCELPATIQPQQFWTNSQPLPTQQLQEATIPALLIKKGGDYPEFWQHPNSFLDVMEDFYIRMRKNNLKQV
jgi:uncharacterized Zn finger protein